MFKTILKWLGLEPTEEDRKVLEVIDRLHKELEPFGGKVRVGRRGYGFIFPSEEQEIAYRRYVKEKNVYRFEDLSDKR